MCIRIPNNNILPSSHSAAAKYFTLTLHMCDERQVYMCCLFTYYKLQYSHSRILNLIVVIVPHSHSARHLVNFDNPRVDNMALNNGAHYLNGFNPGEISTRAIIAVDSSALWPRASFPNKYIICSTDCCCSCASRARQ